MIRILIGISLINLAMDYPLPIAILLISYVFTTEAEKEKIIKLYSNLKSKVKPNKLNFDIKGIKSSFIKEEELKYYNKD